MIKYLIPLILLGGCATTHEVVPYRPPAPSFETPRPVQQQDFGWVVITRANIDQVLQQLEAEGGQVAIFAVTPEGYNSIQLNAADVRRYIQQQQAVIEGYQAYVNTEANPPPPPTPERRGLFGFSLQRQ